MNAYLRDVFLQVRMSDIVNKVICNSSGVQVIVQALDRFFLS